MVAVCLREANNCTPRPFEGFSKADRKIGATKREQRNGTVYSIRNPHLLQIGEMVDDAATFRKLAIVSSPLFVRFKFSISFSSFHVNSYHSCQMILHQVSSPE